MTRPNTETLCYIICSDEKHNLWLKIEEHLETISAVKMDFCHPLPPPPPLRQKSIWPAALIVAMCFPYHLTSISLNCFFSHGLLFFWAAGVSVSNKYHKEKLIERKNVHKGEHIENPLTSIFLFKLNLRRHWKGECPQRRTYWKSFDINFLFKTLKGRMPT